MLFSKTEKRFTKLRSPENVGTESKRAEGAGCRVSEEGMNRVSLPVELERGVVRQHRIRRQLRGHEERVDRKKIRVGSWGDDGVQASSHLYNPTGLSVIGQKCLSFDFASWNP